MCASSEVASGTTRASEFVRLYNEIDGHLRAKAGNGNWRSFADLVRAASERDRTVRQYAGELIGYGELRNAIVHYRTYPDEIIAEPLAEVVITFARIVRIVTTPPLLASFNAKPRLFREEEPLTGALAYMREHDYSQVVVQDGTTLSLMTTEGISRWFAKQAETDLISVSETTIGNVMSEDPTGGFRVMSRRRTIFDARDAFAQHPQHGASRLFAIIVTQNGKLTDEPLGIVTPWDLIEFPDGSSG